MFTKGSNHPNDILDCVFNDNPLIQKGSHTRLIEALANPEYHDFVFNWLKSYFCSPTPIEPPDYMAAYVGDLEWVRVSEEESQKLSMADYSKLVNFGISHCTNYMAFAGELWRIWFPTHPDEVKDIFWSTIEHNRNKIINKKALSGVAEALSFYGCYYPFTNEEKAALTDVYNLVLESEKPTEFGLKTDLWLLLSPKLDEIRAWDTRFPK